MDLDADLENLDRATLSAQVKALRAGIRDHRDKHPPCLVLASSAAWSLLPEKTDPEIEVPEWPQFLRGCIA